MSDKEFATMEGECIAACEEYFKARPQIDTNDRRKVYEAGFMNAYRFLNQKLIESEQLYECLESHCADLEDYVRNLDHENH